MGQCHCERDKGPYLPCYHVRTQKRDEFVSQQIGLYQSPILQHLDMATPCPLDCMLYSYFTFKLESPGDFMIAVRME